MILRLVSVTTALAIAGAAFAQSTNPPATSPSETPNSVPSTAPSAAPSPAPSAAPSTTPSTAATPSATPSAAPARGETAVGGLSKCENMMGNDRDACFQKERAGTGSTR